MAVPEKQQYQDPVGSYAENMTSQLQSNLDWARQTLFSQTILEQKSSLFVRRRWTQNDAK